MRGISRPCETLGTLESDCAWLVLATGSPGPCGAAGAVDGNWLLSADSLTVGVIDTLVGVSGGLVWSPDGVIGVETPCPGTGGCGCGVGAV